MKLLSLIFLTSLVLSCSGTKSVVNNTKKPTPKPTPKTEENGSVANSNTEVIKITDTLYVPDSNEEIEIIEKPILNAEENVPEVFNHNILNNLLKAYVSEAGNVSYKDLKKNHKLLLSYIEQLGKNIPNNAWSKEEKLAYWINAYNAMTIDLILRHYPVKSIKDIKNPWQQRYWKLGEKWYNLDEIEHDILRKMNEPRIHFAIVCASYSCPKLQNEAFNASNLEAQLTNATNEFLSDPERNAISVNNLELSKIFQWFAKDFKQNGSLIDFLNRYSKVEISQNAKKHFKDYSWDLNE
ncbi:uncharacterized protein DUF547 [Jejuia pallidilutea]|uniref:Uncharacterized protein DUF547 n=1 Tax=Jejuia pallidilutea TaxID=504487 RepID=A0A362X3Q3_9FLAO|nr:DUF547 domain-containing protein [Jejuia pallidilutea]PQV51367.1 uncharacterized protein DUF547 [Jejuia pallidilutea]